MLIQFTHTVYLGKKKEREGEESLHRAGGGRGVCLRGVTIVITQSQYKRRRRNTKEGLTLHAIYTPETCVVYN